MLDGDWYSYCNTGMVSMCWEMCVRSWMDGYGRERGRPFMVVWTCMYIHCIMVCVSVDGEAKDGENILRERDG